MPYPGARMRHCAKPKTQVQRVYSLLGSASNPIVSESRCRLLAEAARRHCCWGTVPNLAESHRIAPLLYWLFKQCRISCPLDVRKVLAGIYVRERRIAAAQGQALDEILHAFEQQGFEYVVLKGGALAYGVYAEPGLRPKEDLDILVAEDQLVSAQWTLRSLGFNAPIPENRFQRLSHQMPGAYRLIDGVKVVVELHRNLYNSLLHETGTYARARRPFQSLCILGQQTRLLNATEMLPHLFSRNRILSERMRYIHLADIAGFAETHKDTIDWDALRRNSPTLWNSLEILDYFTPFSDELRHLLEIGPGRSCRVRGIGQDYLGWPRIRFSEAGPGLRAKRRLLLNTLYPPEWWIRLLYGVRSSSPLVSTLLLRHPQYLVSTAVRRLYLGPVDAGSFFHKPL